MALVADREYHVQALRLHYLRSVPDPLAHFFFEPSPPSQPLLPSDSPPLPPRVTIHSPYATPPQQTPPTLPQQDDDNEEEEDEGEDEDGIGADSDFSANDIEDGEDDDDDDDYYDYASSIPPSSSSLDQFTFGAPSSSRTVFTRKRQRRRVNISRNFSRNVSLIRPPNSLTSPAHRRRSRLSPLAPPDSRPRSLPADLSTVLPLSSSQSYKKHSNYTYSSNIPKRYSAPPRLNSLSFKEPRAPPPKNPRRSNRQLHHNHNHTNNHHNHHHHHQQQQPQSALSEKSSSKRLKPPLVSGLSALLNANSSSRNRTPNPLSSIYRIVAAADDSQGLSLIVYYPHAEDAHVPITFAVRKDTTVEEAIGFALMRYWDLEREPKLVSESEKIESNPEALVGDANPVQWNMMVSEDGEIDDDFPALDRTSLIGKVGATELALSHATPNEAAANEITDSRIQRRPSHLVASTHNANLSTNGGLSHVGGGNMYATTSTTAMTNTNNTSTVNSSTVNNINKPKLTPLDIGAALNPPGTISYSSVIGTSAYLGSDLLQSSSINALHVYLRVRIPMASGIEAITTTVHVPSDMYLADVLELICRKRELGSAKEWVLLIADQDMVIPLDRTVEGLQGMHSLRLARKQDVLGLMKERPGRGFLQNTNPSASIFKRNSEPQQPQYVSAADLTSTYKKFVVFRKQPMQLGRHDERVLVIDGPYVHIMSSSDKSTSRTHSRTASFHASHILLCKQSRRTPIAFKFVVRRRHDEKKRYEFEAENAQVAATIVAYVRRIVSTYRGEVERTAPR